MAAVKKAATKQIKFNDLHRSLQVVLVTVTVGILGIIFLSVSDAAPLSWQDRIKLFNSNSQRTTRKTNISLPQSTGGTTNTGGQTIQCGSNGNTSTVTTGNATSSNGGYANTGGNTACGH